MAMSTTELTSDVRAVEQLREAHKQLRQEMGKIIVGQEPGKEKMKTRGG